MMATLGWLILWIPFFSAAGIALFLRRRPKAAGWTATGSLCLTFLMTLALLLAFLRQGQGPVESSLVWIPLPQAPIEFGILLNPLTVIMLLVVTGVGSLIFLFSNAYMERDESFSRYFASLSLFAFSMLGIVLANNFIQIFIFWELVGLSSYLLIGFWFEKPEASTAGKKAFLTTRVGDVGMMIGILTLFAFLSRQGLGSFNFLVLEESLKQAVIPSGWMTFLCIGIFLGVAGKSAQMPLHVWLPDAMEGPTPVSALIHAATMVAAGVFLLARVFFLFEFSPQALAFIAWTGVITSVVAATIALVQDDIKKVLAYSTLSQLGYMVMALGLSGVEAGMFHLTTHAFFKACLFLGAGSLIHAMHTQDIWKMSHEARCLASQGTGSAPLVRRMPVTAVTFLVAAFALMGIPPLSGFFSKEEILLAASHGPKPLFLLAMTVVLMTAFYMGRVITVVFFPDTRNASKERPEHAVHEGDWRMRLPLILLGILSVIAGKIGIKEFLSGGHHTAAHHAPLSLVIASLLLAFLGAGFAWLLFRKRVTSGLAESHPLLRYPGRLFARKYYFDDFYDFLIRFFQENLAALADALERHVVVQAGVNGLAGLTKNGGDFLRRLQTGVVQFYAFLFTAGITAILYFFILCGKP
jgi:NADH-quinone oxidoreductase subunit L